MTSTKLNGAQLRHLCSRLPVDIIVHNIMPRLTPESLAKWARVNRAFRRTVLHNTTLWKNVLALVPGLPACPEGVEPIDYARLIFGHWCYQYARSLGSVSAFSSFESDCAMTVKPILRLAYYGSIFHSSLPLFVGDYIALKTQLETLHGCPLDDFKAEQRERTSKVIEREEAARCKVERIKLREDKAMTVLKTLTAEGYGDLVTQFGDKLKKEPEFKIFLKASSTLTTKFWTANSPTIVKALERLHNEHIARGVANAQKERDEAAELVLRRAAALFDLVRLPDLRNSADMAFFPDLSALLADATKSPSDVATVQNVVEFQLWRWRWEVLNRPFWEAVSRDVHDGNPQGPINGSSLALAMVVFRHTSSSTSSEFRPHYPFPLQVHVASGTLEADRFLSACICRILSRCNLIPTLTTWSHVEVKDYRFVCRPCLESDYKDRGGPLVRNWWRTFKVKHLQKKHCAEKDTVRLSPAIDRVSEEIEKAVRAVEPRRLTPTLRCIRCFAHKGSVSAAYFSEGDDLKGHLVSEHNLSPDTPNPSSGYCRVTAVPSHITADDNHGVVVLFGAGYFTDVPAEYQTTTRLRASNLYGLREQCTVLRLGQKFGVKSKNTMRLFSTIEDKL
ncbi:hypothetical protein EXIGLDRAFT_746129 [Exidia glandulosa HHB12029]|uniref:F-box domain-containing protein n=1 Tax=Exidia glandulosa HHB12029 TaxID=1314781 RepID=A0A165MNP4_EXIGL|nr:hypothetical protein EXIGLDRAFT_746129 [Exidia glandulosa HHB12029]